MIPYQPRLVWYHVNTPSSSIVASRLLVGLVSSWGPEAKNSELLQLNSSSILQVNVDIQCQFATYSKLMLTAYYLYHSLEK